LDSKETKGVSCPFCGAPYKKLIPPDVLQLTCDYCGATFRTPPRIGVEIPQCHNHPERFAVGICNDCGENFCSQCLQTYDFKTRDRNAMLYLCPSCLRDRYLKKANNYILSGTLLLLIGTPFAIVLLPVSIFLMIIGAIEVVYGFSKRREANEEFPVQELQAQEEMRADQEGGEDVEAELLYSKLLTKYIEHWGVHTGIQLLDNEIRAYTWHGETFAEAVKKVYERQQRKTYQTN
jgi:hypothetical protein